MKKTILMILFSLISVNTFADGYFVGDDIVLTQDKEFLNGGFVKAGTTGFVDKVFPASSSYQIRINCNKAHNFKDGKVWNRIMVFSKDLARRREYTGVFVGPNQACVDGNPPEIEIKTAQKYHEVMTRQSPRYRYYATSKAGYFSFEGIVEPISFCRDQGYMRGYATNGSEDGGSVGLGRPVSPDKPYVEVICFDSKKVPLYSDEVLQSKQCAELNTYKTTYERLSTTKQEHTDALNAKAKELGCW